MAFPTLADADTTKSTGVGTSAVVDLPTTVDPGDLLIILIGTDGDNTFSWTNFTEIAEGDDGKNIALACAYKIAVGDEDGGTETVTLGSNEQWAACCYRITAGTHGGASNPPEASTIATGASAAADPTTCTPTGGAKDYLWITFISVDDAGVEGSTQPSGYSDMEYQNSSTPGGVGVVTAYRTNNAASEDAGAWSNPDNQWCAYTIAIHPAGAQAYSMDAGPGSYTYTGVAATLAHNRFMDAGPGSYVYTGAAADLVKAHNYEMDAGPGSYVYTGAAATLGWGRFINAEPGSYTYTGLAATLVHNYFMNAEPGSYTYTGVAATLLAALLMNAEPGSYALTGIAAELVYTPVGGDDYVLDAGPGSYVYTGVQADLVYAHDYEINAEPGSYVYTGVAAALAHGYNMNAEPGSYVYSGLGVTLARGIVLPAEPTTYTYTGAPATLIWSGAAPGPSKMLYAVGRRPGRRRQVW